MGRVAIAFPAVGAAGAATAADTVAAAVDEMRKKPVECMGGMIAPADAACGAGGT